MTCFECEALNGNVTIRRASHLMGEPSPPLYGDAESVRRRRPRPPVMEKHVPHKLSLSTMHAFHPAGVVPWPCPWGAQDTFGCSNKRGGSFSLINLPIKYCISYNFWQFDHIVVSYFSSFGRRAPWNLITNGTWPVQFFCIIFFYCRNTSVCTLSVY